MALAVTVGLLLVAAVAAATAVTGTIPATDQHTLVTSAVTPPTTAATTTTAPTTTTTTPPPSTTPKQAWAVGVATFQFVDRSRPTGSAGGDPGASFRTLTTVVRYPSVGPPSAGEQTAAAADRRSGPFPLIVFAHGYDASPSTYATLLHAWASSGYVVAAPAFPRAVAGGPLDEGDLVNQPADVSYVIGQLVAAARPGQPLGGLVDVARIAVAGHSDGASTAVGVGYGVCCHDPRVKADAVMEGDDRTFPMIRSSGPPLLVIQGDSDAINPPNYGQQVFADGPSPKFLLRLIHGQHLEPFTSDQPHLTVVQAATLAFFDRYLKAKTPALDRMRAAATPNLATLTAG
jgi:predicted dienelactone hydrolase